MGLGRIKVGRRGLGCVQVRQMHQPGDIELFRDPSDPGSTVNMYCVEGEIPMICNVSQ